MLCISLTAADPSLHSGCADYGLMQSRVECASSGATAGLGGQRLATHRVTPIVEAANDDQRSSAPLFFRLHFLALH